MQVRVECYAGYEGEETPRKFFLGERTVEVETVLDSWLAPDHRYFRVRGNDHSNYTLRYDVRSEFWELI